MRREGQLHPLRLRHRCLSLLCVRQAVDIELSKAIREEADAAVILLWKSGPSTFC